MWCSLVPRLLAAHRGLGRPACLARGADGISAIQSSEPAGEILVGFTPGPAIDLAAHIRKSGNSAVQRRDFVQFAKYRRTLSSLRAATRGVWNAAMCGKFQITAGHWRSWRETDPVCRLGGYRHRAREWPQLLSECHKRDGRCARFLPRFCFVTIGEGRRLAQLLRVKRKEIKKTRADPLCYRHRERSPRPSYRLRRPDR
jgi:hypothetical protein